MYRRYEDKIAVYRSSLQHVYQVSYVIEWLRPLDCGTQETLQEVCVLRHLQRLQRGQQTMFLTNEVFTQSLQQELLLEVYERFTEVTEVRKPIRERRRNRRSRPKGTRDTGVACHHEGGLGERVVLDRAAQLLPRIERKEIHVVYVATHMTRYTRSTEMEERHGRAMTTPWEIPKLYMIKCPFNTSEFYDPEYMMDYLRDAAEIYNKDKRKNRDTAGHSMI
eukprot:2024448-Amphidinium_carterae.2